MNDIEKLDKVIRENAPSLKPATFHMMNGEALGFGMLPYQTRSMKEPAEWPVISIKQQKNYISIYVMCTTDGQYVAERYQPKLGNVSCGKSCIRFRRLEDINLNGLKEMLQEINRRYEAGENLYEQ